MKDNFYRAFEDKYRGSREFIKKRLEVYLPFILPLKENYTHLTALDIGCGRGEWLELLKENDIDGQGIDLDEGMLEACQNIELNVTHGEGITMLKGLADESLTIISAFHVVEHIPFDDTQILINEALRVLKPGGLLILETPNPENIKVATENFYLDPTHTKPVPSALLSFMTEYYGYKRTKVLRLQEPKGISDQVFANLGQVIEGVSPDYAVIAQKDASSEILFTTNNIFSKEFGLSFSALSEKFEMRMIHFQTEINHALEQANHALEQANHALEQVNQIQEMILNSKSWKITKPLRLASKLIKWFIQGSIAWLTFTPHSRPRRVLNQFLNFFKRHNNNYYEASKPELDQVNNNNIDSLSPRAKQIFNSLKNNMKHQKDEK